MEAAARGPKTEKTPLVGSVQFGGMPAHTSTDGLLNTSSNVILHFRLHSLERMSTINFALAICSLVYLAINIVMIVFNWTANFDGDCDDPDSLYIQRCGSPISEYGFHMMEFWATFGFAIIEAYALLNTPKTLSTIYESPLQLKLILFFDIVASLVPSVLITFDIEHFEIISHELEYANELTMSFVDLVILASLVRVGHRRGCPGRSPEVDSSASRGPTTWTTSLLRNAADAPSSFFAAIAVVVATAQLLTYNGMGTTPDGDKVGEKPAHYCEFCFEIMSSLISFGCVGYSGSSTRARAAPPPPFRGRRPVT